MPNTKRRRMPAAFCTGLAILLLICDETSQREVARDTKIDPAVVSKLRTGAFTEDDVSARVIKKLATYFNVQPEFLTMWVSKDCLHHIYRSSCPVKLG